MLPPHLHQVVQLGKDLEARTLFFWRLFFRHLLASCTDGGEVQEVFGRAAATRKQNPSFAPSLLSFVRGDVGPWLATLEEAGGAAAAGRRGGGARGSLPKEKLDELLRRVRVAERVLAAATSGGRTDGSAARPEE